VDDGLATNPYSTFGDITPVKNEGHRNGSGSTHARRKDIPVLEDFELVRVIGKGCAGRVSPISSPFREHEKGLTIGHDGSPY